MVLRLATRRVDAWPDVAPCAVVQRLLLAPHEFGVGVLVEVRRDLRARSADRVGAQSKDTYQVIWERRDLLDTADRDVLDALRLTLSDERVVHLTRAEDVFPDLLRRNELVGVRLGDVALEVGLADHLRQLRASTRVTQKLLGEEQDERFPEVAVDLAAEDVELEGALDNFGRPSLMQYHSRS